MSRASSRLVRALAVIAAGALLIVLRRWALPSFFELQGIPLEIAGPSNLNSCYGSPALATCGDSAVVALTVIAMVAALGWGSRALTIFASILAIPPLVLYFAFAPLWLVLAALAFIPLALEVGLLLLAPRES